MSDKLVLRTVAFISESDAPTGEELREKGHSLSITPRRISCSGINDPQYVSQNSHQSQLSPANERGGSLTRKVQT